MFTKYNKKIAATIADLIRSDTYTVAEICAIAKITKPTFYKWQRDYPEFAQIVEEAKRDQMDVMVVGAKKSLLRKIQGMDVTETKVKAVPNGKRDFSGHPEAQVKEVITTTRHIPPDTESLIFTLTNQDPAHWKNRQTHEIKAGRRTPAEKMSDERLDAEIKRMTNALHKDNGQGSNPKLSEDEH